VTPLDAASGFTTSGIPYNRFGSGPRTLVLFQGLVFENKPMSGLDARFTFRLFSFLGSDYTVYAMPRKPGLPRDHSIEDMADDYAETIEQEFGGPVDVLGLSTGGSICLPFAADHPDLVRKLVVHSAAYALAPHGKGLQLRTRALVEAGQWRRAGAVMMEWVIRPSWYSRALIWASSPLMALRPPDDPSDLIVTIDAEDVFDFRERLREIAVPTLVVAGEADPGYTPALFRETAEGIPDARLALYPGMGHPARGERFGRDVLDFLRG
jgi:pimeloyl-ACP methyl ester carboxylesterase